MSPLTYYSQFPALRLDRTNLHEICWARTWSSLPTLDYSESDAFLSPRNLTYLLWVHFKDKVTLMKFLFTESDSITVGQRFLFSLSSLVLMIAKGLLHLYSFMTNASPQIDIPFWSVIQEKTPTWAFLFIMFLFFFGRFQCEGLTDWQLFTRLDWLLPHLSTVICS